jgi:alpha-maltose-1-phosphate synthase
MGGEAIKAFQYFEYLLNSGHDAVLLTHARCRQDLIRAFPEDRLLFVEDGFWQVLFWRSRVFRFLVPVCFHLAAARLIRGFEPRDTVVHYLCPVSPVQPRFPPKSYDVVMGPLTGAIYFPPGFQQRMPLLGKLKQRFHGVTQRLFGVLSGEKKRARVVLVSGYERTRKSLLDAGCQPHQLKDVVDSGVFAKIAEMGRVQHTGKNLGFICSGRLVDLKGVDLAIRAVARTRQPVTLTICGDGPERARLEQLAAELEIADRVRFKGWMQHDQLIETIRTHRGYLFPSLAEANGIVMQEAMMAGIPVVTLRWGGPAHLADDTSAIFIEPTDEATVVAGLADAMDRLALDAALAEKLSDKAREIAKARYGWPQVGASWSEFYST